jgi:class 3 adenylate cyclase
MTQRPFGEFLDTLSLSTLVRCRSGIRRKGDSGKVSDSKAEHRFAVVMCADVVGYSRLMGIDEEGTLAALNAVRRNLVDPTIDAHRGRIVRTMGDGLLV